MKKTHEQFTPNTISLHLASPDTIRKWSSGEIQKPETINYRTGRSERGGLFDERIFGPEKDYECYCKKYRGVKYRGIICEKCGVEVTRAVVRRERMGHIELAAPVSHIWFLRGIPSRMSLLLDISITNLEKVIYFAGYIVTSVDEDEKKRIVKEIEQEYKTRLKTLTSAEDRDKLQEVFSQTKKDVLDLAPGSVLSEMQFNKFSLRFSTVFEAGIGAEAVYEIFKGLDLEKMSAYLTEELANARKTNRAKLEKRLNLVNSLLQSETRPEWMFLTMIPVIPPALRPMVALEGGRHATSDVNDLYRRVINRNNRLKKMQAIGAPDVILRNEKRILQEAVDSLIDNSIRKHSGGAAMSQSQRRKLKSLSDNLKGKQGLFRQNLLGKRVDYSGRSVIVVGPRLKLHQCGLPKYMALELFRPFVISKILERELAFNIRGAGKLIEEAVPEVWEILEEVIKGRYVLLNRAPTLHRLSIQAFQPILIEGKAIQVHPLVCSAFNADFDGDQMAVHVPLSKESQREARYLIAANKNILKPQDGEPIAVPSQDMVLGVYWMTKMVEGAKGEGRMFSSPNEAITAYDFGAVDFRAKIKVLPTDSERYNEFENKPFETTIGRLLFNTIMPKSYVYINKELKKGDIAAIIQDLITRFGIDETALVLDKIKNFGYKYVTLSGTTIGMDEIKVPEQKKQILEDARKEIAKLDGEFDDGLISFDERYRKRIETWEGAKIAIEKHIEEILPEAESMSDMIFSKARGSLSNMSQMGGMKGLIVNTQGRTIDFPITPSYKEGLSPIEYFITTHGSRKGLTDTALNTAKAGYLTRRLVDVAQDVVVREHDCGTKKSIRVTPDSIDGLERPISLNLYGRRAAQDIVGSNGEVIVKAEEIITSASAQKCDQLEVQEAFVYSPLTCEAAHGLCVKCYGLDMGRNREVKLGESVGVVAAQAIGEPGTQLTLRTFHAGGVTGLDITTGLPRIEEIFERRNPKTPALVAEEAGEVIEIRTTGDTKTIVVLGKGADGKDTPQQKEYSISARRMALVKKGDTVEGGDILSDGSASIQEVFDFGGLEKAQAYIINEVNKVYDVHASPISPKHVEIVIKQMFSRRKIKNPGDSEFTTGEIVENIELKEVNNKLKEAGKTPAQGDIISMGITEVSLSTKSWLSSASFQHTTRTLINNAVRGEEDELRGLKENVILGSLIPAGTGLSPDFISAEDIGTDTE